MTGPTWPSLLRREGESFSLYLQLAWASIFSGKARLSSVSSLSLSRFQPHSLTHTLSLSLSLFVWQRPSLIKCLWQLIVDTRWSFELRQWWNVGGQLGGGCWAVEEARVTHAAESRFHSVPLPFSSQPTGYSQCQDAQLNLLFKMVPYVHDESARIVSTFFRAKRQNFVSWFEPNRVLF